VNAKANYTNDKVRELQRKLYISAKSNKKRRFHALTKYIDSPQNTISFSIKIDKCIAYHVFDYFEEHEIKSNEDGTFTVSLNYPKDEWLYGIISFGNHAKIISPESLKSEVANISTKITNIKYFYS